LDKLSAGEIQALNNWLNNYLQQTPGTPALAPTSVAAAAVPAITPPVTVATVMPAPTAVLAPVIAAAPAPTVAPTAASSPANFGKRMLSPEETGEAQSIESTIPGRFMGWTGETVFTLANGQVWKQAGPGYYETHLKDPVIVIKRLGIGYLLTLPGESSTVFVRRLH